VSKPREQAVDGEVMCKLADHGLELVKNLQSGGAGCTPAALVARLKAQHVPGWNPQAQGADQVRHTHQRQTHHHSVWGRGMRFDPVVEG
jgi:hypothetical protein